VVRDFRGAARVEQAFGTADNSRGYLLRYPDRSDPRYAGQPKLTADNGPLGALRRGGLLGLAGFLLGAVLVLRRTMRRGLPAWIPITVLAALTSAVTEDEVAGTTPAWLMVALAELAVLYLIRAPAGDAATTSAYAASRVPVTASEVNVDR
jgi:hypothetical protein